MRKFGMLAAMLAGLVAATPAGAYRAGPSAPAAVALTGVQDVAERGERRYERGRGWGRTWGRERHRGWRGGRWGWRTNCHRQWREGRSERVCRRIRYRRYG